MIYKEYFENLRGKRVAVIGVGVSNTPLIKMLVKYGAKVTACDKRENLGDAQKELSALGVSFSLGDAYLENIEADIIFKSPGIRDDLPQLVKCVENGAVLTSEMEAFFDVCPAEIIAVTGSDGKTTTTTLVCELLKEEGYKCHLGGNIGKPLLPEIESIGKEDKVIVELSSFQLKTMKKSPSVAVITNLSPNHLDWHKGMEEYIESKKNIFKFQNENSRLVTNSDNEITSEIYKEAKGEVMLFSRKGKADICLVDNYIAVKGEKIVNCDEILLPGVHNVENYMAAIGATYKMVSRETIVKVAKNFAKIPHRIEFVRELEGVKYYNDSIASSPTRSIAGLNSFNQKVILIAGGYDKHIPYDILGTPICEKVKKLVLVGATSPKIKEAVLNSEKYNKEEPEIIECTEFKEAILKAKEVAKPGDIVILSPASASFDMFKNFEERGNLFKKIVGEL